MSFAKATRASGVTVSRSVVAGHDGDRAFLSHEETTRADIWLTQSLSDRLSLLLIKFADCSDQDWYQEMTAITAIDLIIALARNINVANLSAGSVNLLISMLQQEAAYSQSHISAPALTQALEQIDIRLLSPEMAQLVSAAESLVGIEG